MKRFPPFTAILVWAVAALAACLIQSGCGSQTYASDDFTVDLYTPVHASGFDIRTTREQQEWQQQQEHQEGDAAVLITVRNPWQGASGVEQRLLVLHGDAKAPAAFDGQVVRAPVERVVCMSSSHVALMDAIGQAHRISGVSGIDYISNADIRTRRAKDAVRDVGYDTNIDFELLAAMRPSLVMLYGVTGENTTITAKLRELRIPYFYIGDYMEPSPLGKAEWMVLAAELCGCRERGMEIFNAVARRYDALKASVAQRGAKRPKVMLNTPYRDTWFMPSVHNFMVRLVEDAGGEYIYPQNDSATSVAIDIEQAYMLAAAADVWLNVGACNTLEELTSQNPRFANIAAVRARRVWNNNRRQTAAGGSDFWESAVVRPDRVLEDLAAIFRDAASTPNASAADASLSGAPASIPPAARNAADSTYYYKRLQ